MWEVDLPPLSCGVFLPLPPLQVFLLLVAGHVPLLLPSLAGLFIYSSMKDFPSTPFGAWAPHPLCYVSFLLLLLIIQSGNGMGVLLVSPFNMEWKKTVTQVTPETPAHPCLLRHYSQ
jgi:hypothetical protein